MPRTSEATAPPSSCQTWDVNDPVQVEISQLLENLQYDIMGIISLGKDGIMRSLTSDREVLSAEPFSSSIPIRRRT